MLQTLKSYLCGLGLHSPQSHSGINIIPLVSPTVLPPEYLSLKEALKQGKFIITEVSVGGSVPNLKVRNDALLPVLLLDGEELKGAKQNRVLNTSVLVGAQSELIVPVSCTEAGRWSYQDTVFKESGNVLSHGMRASKMGRVSESLKQSRGYDAEQSVVWSEINCLHAEHQTFSNTSAMEDVFVKVSASLDEICANFPCVEGQCGIYVEIEGKFAGMDLLSLPSAWKDVHDKIIRSYAIDVIRAPKSGRAMPPEAFSAWVESLEACELNSGRSVGLGEDIRLECKDYIGSVLAVDKAFVHIAVYPHMSHTVHERYFSPRNRDRTLM